MKATESGRPTQESHVPNPWLAASVKNPQTGAPPPLRGFTLIELMVVVAIIAILALMAVPLYRDKYIRDQVVEAMRLTEIAKGPIAAAWSATRTLPDDNAAAGLPAPDKVVSNYVKSLTVEAGAIHVTFGNLSTAALRGKTLSLRPAVVEDAPIVPVAWVCGYAAAPEKMTVVATNRTDVPKVWLPVNCR
jgi:type IV pilus assembly protein PilA